MSAAAKILVVDDSELDRRLFCQVLAKKGFVPVALESGQGVLEHIELEQPDLVLMDMMMPVVSGNQALQRIRERHSPLALPVIMITSQSDAPHVVESLGLGANDYITKPIDVQITLMRIGTQLKVAELSREMLRLKEAEAIAAMVTTYKHEINNPLAIAIGSIGPLMELHGADANLQRLAKALDRVAAIVRAINEIDAQSAIAYGPYARTSAKLVKLK